MTEVEEKISLIRERVKNDALETAIEFADEIAESVGQNMTEDMKAVIRDVFSTGFVEGVSYWINKREEVLS